MSVVLEAATAPGALALPQADKHVNGGSADVLEEFIAAHREALLALAPRQEDRAVRVETAWHIAELGLLLRVRDVRIGAG
jgi:hypothetical protein